MPDFAHIGINAHLVSTRPGYRAAGTSQYVASLLAALRELESAETITAYLSRRHVPRGLSPTPRFRLRLSMLPTWRPAIRILWEQFLWPALLRGDGVDIVHGPAHALPLSWPGRSVVTIHDLSFLVDPTTFRSANQRYLRSMVKLSIRKADRVIAVSESTRRDVIRLLGVEPGRIDVVYEGVADAFHPIDPSAVSAFRTARGLTEPFILFLGTIEPRKNLNRLLDAYAEIRRRRPGATLPLIIAGGKGLGAESIMTHCEALGLGDSVRFVGFVPEDEKPLWYNSACLFVFPSQYEGFGLPVLEAFACGTPVVASNRSSLPEVVGNAGLLVDPFDTVALADAIQRLIGDDELRQGLAAAGIEQASRFSWKAAAEKTLDVYRSARGKR